MHNIYLSGIPWSKEIAKRRKFNTYEALVKSSLLLQKDSKKRVEVVEMERCTEKISENIEKRRN